MIIASIGCLPQASLPAQLVEKPVDGAVGHAKAFAQLPSWRQRRKRMPGFSGISLQPSDQFVRNTPHWLKKTKQFVLRNKYWFVSFKETMSLTLLVLAAGMGSRYGGLKQMDPMGPSGETVLDYSVYDALRSGFDRVVFVIRKDFESEFRDRIGRKYEGKIAVDYVFQDLSAIPEGFSVPEGRTKPWGTGHAIWSAREVVNTPFLAINADDFYGVDAYERMAKFLNKKQAKQFAMAGYLLRNTLSEFGAVARGVCRVNEAGILSSITEMTQIQREGEQIANKEGEHTIALSGEEMVSMNFWGFTPEVFPLLEQLLKDFLATEGQALKSEFYIPSAVMSMVVQGSARVHVLETSAQWFGVTYKEDKPRVVDSIRNLVAKGDYPGNLWQ